MTQPPQAMEPPAQHAAGPESPQPIARDDITVIIAAAGGGYRLGLGPKAQLALAGRTLEEWMVRKAQRMAGEVIVASVPGAPPLPAGMPHCVRIEGGATRQESVRRLAHAATRPWVSVWHVSRPFASIELAQAVLREARDGSGAAGAFLHMDVPVAITQGGEAVRGTSKLIPGRNAAILQTPLGFARELLLDVVDRAQRQGWDADSTVELVLRAGYAVGVVPGEKRNIKLTTAEDWDMAQGLAAWLE